MTQPPKFIILALSACNFLIGVGAFVIIGILKTLGEGLGVAPERDEIFMTIYALSYALLSPLLVYITGHIHDDD